MNKYAIVALCLLVSGCMEPARTSEESNGSIYITNRAGSAGITEFQLSDGTKCVALLETYKGAITCNWQNSVRHPEKQDGL